MSAAKDAAHLTELRERVYREAAAALAAALGENVRLRSERDEQQRRADTETVLRKELGRACGEIRDRAGDTLTLLWRCHECGWVSIIDAPGFAGDGQWHFPDGRTACGPISAQRTHRRATSDG